MSGTVPGSSLSRPEGLPFVEVNNIYDKIPTRLPAEFTEVLAGSPAVRIERIISWGQASPGGFWYDQEGHEWVLLLKGKAVLQFREPDETLVLEPGAWINIAAHRKHRVEWTDISGETVWLAVHYT